MKRGWILLATVLALLLALAFIYSLERPSANGDRTAEVAAVEPDWLKAQLDGSMKKLVVHPAPKPVPAAALVDADGKPVDLAAWQGKWVVLNLWATWCAPCRKEMPALDALNKTYDAKGLSVVTVATGPNPVPAIRAFFDETGVTSLPMVRDPDQAFARALGVFGLPTTLLLDPAGREVARMQGEADWAAPEAHRLAEALLSRR